MSAGQREHEAHRSLGEPTAAKRGQDLVTDVAGVSLDRISAPDAKTDASDRPADAVEVHRESIRGNESPCCPGQVSRAQFEPQIAIAERSNNFVQQRRHFGNSSCSVAER